MVSNLKAPVERIPLAVNESQHSRPQAWVHLVAGASGGIVTSIVTSPLDVLRTRLQSDLYQSPPRGSRPSLPSVANPLHHVRETFSTIAAIRQTEGWRGLFRGLGPSIAGVAPAAAVKYYVYGNCKRLGARCLDCTENDSLVHATAAVAAGIATATATNPIWLIKTRLQLDKTQAGGLKAVRRYKGSLDCARKVLQQEGIPGFYRGLSASYLGTVETVIHLVLYERIKTLSQSLSGRLGTTFSAEGEFASWISTSVAASSAKVAAVLATYPHEVVRTRLRQAPADSVERGYSGLVQCFRMVLRQEGWRGLYGGLTPHLVRSIPSAVLTLGVYEFVLRLAGASKRDDR